MPPTTSKHKSWLHRITKLFAQKEKAEALNPSDVLIAVMGPPGAGKSTFINTTAGLQGGQALKVYHNLAGGTTDVTHVVCYEQGNERSERIILVDTPPIDPNTLIITAQKLEKWLKDISASGTRITAIIYVYNVTSPRMNEKPLTVLQTFQDFFKSSDVFPSRLAVVANRLDPLKPIHIERETELKAYVDSKINLSQIKTKLVSRFDNTRESGWRIIDSVFL